MTSEASSSSISTWAQERTALLEQNLRELATAIALGQAGKIHAIKAWRAATGEPLKESKNHIEALASGAEQGVESADRFNRIEARLMDAEFRLSSIIKALARGE